MMKLIRWMISGGVLPEKPRLVLQSIVWQEKPYKQVAAEMGISVNTVKTYYARALQALQKAKK